MAQVSRTFPILLVVLWSTGFIGARMGMPYAEPLSFLSLRFFLAILILAGLVTLTSAKWPNWRIAGHCAVVGLLLHGISLGAIFWAIDRGMPAGISAMIMGLQPIVVAVVAGPLFDERLTARHWLGLIVGIVGLLLVLAPKFEFGNSGITPFNIAISLGAMLGLTFGAIYQKQFATSAPLQTGTLWQYIGALLPVTLYALVFENWQFEWNGELIFALGWLVLVLSIGAVFLLMYLINKTNITEVSSLFYLVPSSTAIIAWLLFDETLSWIQIFGMLLCATAVRFAIAGKNKNQ